MYPEYTEEWKTFQGLQKLVLQVESPFIHYEQGYHEAPKYISCLRSQARSLEDLQLYSNEQYCTSDGTFVEMSPHCAGQWDLRHFKKPRSLALTDMSLMGVSTKGPAHWHQSFEDTLKHLAQMFPTSLETFTHLIWGGPSPFALEVPVAQQMLRSWENIWKASAKDKFPSLRKVMVQKYGLNGVSDERVVIWQREE